MLLLTVIRMQRDRNNTVTDDAALPVLVPCSPEEAEGVATFAPEDGEAQSVRAFRTSDIKNAKKHLPGHAGKRFAAVMKLKRALESPDDPLAREEALRALAGANKLTRSSPENPLRSETPPDVPDHLVADVVEGKLSGERLIKLMEHYEGLRPGESARSDARWLLSYEVSMEFKRARLVLWWTGQKFRPALWCPDMKTAFYSRVLLGVVSGKGLCICPKCGVLFVQDRPDQTYCTIKHRESHRVARWRAQQNIKRVNAAKTRRSNGTNKTR
jgi:hypothetical protein